MTADGKCISRTEQCIFMYSRILRLKFYTVSVSSWELGPWIQIGDLSMKFTPQAQISQVEPCPI